MSGGDVEALLELLHRLNVRVFAHGNELAIDGPTDIVDHLVHELRIHKADLLRYLQGDGTDLRLPREAGEAGAGTDMAPTTACHGFWRTFWGAPD
jgi:hypothetical protein